MTEMLEQRRWNLSDLLEAPRGAPLENALADVETRTAKFESSRMRLKSDIDEEDFLDLVVELEQLSRTLARVEAYAELWFTENTQDASALSFKSRMEQLAAQIANRTLFFTLWWKDLDDGNAARLLRSAGDYTYWLELIRLFKTHTLSEAEEKIINLKDVNGIGGVVTLYDMLTNRYQFTLEVKGEKRTMTQGELLAFVRHPSAEVRANAYRELFRVYTQDKAIIAQMFAHRVNDWKTEQMELRHFSSPISARNLSNDVPDAAVDAMLEVCRANALLFQRYFKLKAKWLELSPMRRSDVYAPLGNVELNYPYDEAVNLVLDSFERFSPTVAAAARIVFEANHIDSQVRPGKMSGAFCASILPEMVPYVLVNYSGKARDVATLAHELGHATHARLAQGHSFFTFQAPLPLAETASVFSEMILNERLLRENSDPSVRRDILARILDDAYATVMRQSFLALFEKEAHAAVDNAATPDKISTIYFENLRTQFGDAVELHEDFKWEWLVISHFFHVPFYVYAYSFGQLLTLALYQRYREEGDKFKPNYLKILAYGGSAGPAKVLGETGIDINSSSFWQGGFDVIKGFVDQLEEMEEKRTAVREIRQPN